MPEGAEAEVSSIYITGIGFSGTTFLLQLFRELGYSVGGPLRGTERKGMEWMPFVDAATSIGSAVGRNAEPYLPTWTDMQYEPSRRIIAELDSPTFAANQPDVIKCPEYGQALALDRFELAQPVIVAHRDLIEAVPAWRRDHPLTLHMTDSQIYNALATAFGHLIDRLATYGIEYRVLIYPRTVREPDYCYAMLIEHLHGKALDYRHFKQAHDRVADPSLVHQA